MSAPALVFTLLLGTAPVFAATPAIELIDAGASPRQPLRFHPTPGSKEPMRMTLATTNDMVVGDTAVPTMTTPTVILDLDIEVLEIEDDGDIRYRFTVADTDVRTDGTASAEDGQAVLATLQPLAGAWGEVTVSPTGVLRETSLTPPAGADPKIIDDMANTMANASAPLPTEPVGLGARWVLHTDLEQGTLKLKQLATYEVVELTDTAVTLRVDLQQSAGAQPFPPDSMPAGASADLRSLSSTGSGRSVLTFDRVMPTLADTTLHTNMDVTLHADGQSMDMHNTTNLTTHLGPR